MTNTNNKRINKTIVGISFSLLMAVSGTMIAAPQSAHAAVAYNTNVADNVIATGKQFLGTRYQHGAQAGRTDVFDCSSFTQYVFKQNGIELPRSSRQQSAVGTAVSKSELQPGDLVFSDTNHDGTINHVSIYMGNDKLLHTYRVGIGVTISNFSGSTWDKTFVSARRVIKNNGQDAAVKPQPVKEAPQPVKETPQPVKEAPQPVKEAPQPVKETPQPSVDKSSDNYRYTAPVQWKQDDKWDNDDDHRKSKDKWGNDHDHRETKDSNHWFNQMFFKLF